MKTIDQLLADGVAGKRVFVRADLNVPLDGTAITDDGRIRAVVPTVAKLAEAGARVVVASHLGRPKGAPDPDFSLAPAAERLGELLGADVAFATDTVGESAKAVVRASRTVRSPSSRTSASTPARRRRTTPSAEPSPTGSPSSPICTSETASAPSTASTPRSTTSRPGFRTPPATSSPPRSAS